MRIPMRAGLLTLLRLIETALRCALALAFVGTVAAAERAAPTRAEPTRAEILRGALGPMRTCYDVTSYNLDVRIDPETRTIKGFNRIAFKVVEDFQTLQVDLFESLAIDRILFNDGTPAQFTRELSAVFVELPEKVSKGGEHSVTVYYSGQPLVARRPPWQGGVIWSNDGEGNPWVAVACQGTGASCWWPNKDHPADEPDNMTISITVPPGLENISNGRLKSRTELPDGWVRYEWFVSYPINNYCVTFNIGKFAHFSDEYVSADGEKLTLDYYVLPKNLEKAKVQFTQTKPMLRAFEKYFGKYPFSRDGFKLIESPHSGMEHQSAVAYGNEFRNGYRGRASSAVGLKFDFIIVHESAHEWWGNNVSQDDIADMWIHESFGAYAESLFVEDVFGRAEALKYINGKKSNVRNLRPIIGERGLDRRGDADMYDKGQLVLNTLRSVLDDDELWISILRGLQEDFRLQTVSSDQVFDYISKKANRDLSWFFDQYFRHASIPRLTIQLEKRGDVVTARHRWETDVENFQMPIKVATGPGKYEVLRPSTSMQTTEFRGIDPEEFKVPEDLYYVDVRVRRSYLNPGNEPAALP